MRSHSKFPLPSWRGAIRSGVALAAMLLVLAPAHAEVNGNLPPTLIFAPTVGTTISFTGVTSVGSNGSAQLAVTPSGGSGTGATATTGFSCTFTGNAAGNFTVNPVNSNYQPGGGTTNLALSCVSGNTVRTSTLSCSESPFGISPTLRNWPVSCPAGTVDVPPNLAYLPTAGTQVLFAAATPIIGSSATAQIRVTPSGGVGSGLPATSKLGQCTVSNETVPGTFGGFQNVTLTFVGATTIAQNLNLTAVLRSTPVSGTLTCTETIGDVLGPGATGNITTRSWPLQSGAGQSPARLSITKTASASSVLGDTDFSYTITVSNDGSSAQTGIVILDDVPSALTVQSASGAGWNCSVVGNAVDCRRNSLGASSTSSVDVAVRAPSTAQAIVNTARATSVEARNPVSSTASVTVLPPSASSVDLRLDKRDSADPVLANAFFSYTLEVQNVGERPASGVVITDTLPSDVVFNTASGTGWTCSGSTSISCTLAGQLAAGSSSVVNIVVRAPRLPTDLSNTAQVSSTEVDSNPADNSDSEATRINEVPTPPVPQADLAVSAVAVPATAVTGQQVEFRVTALNLGPNAARGVNINAIIPSVISIISASGAGWSCTTNQQSVVCSRAAELAVNQSADLVIRGTLRPGSTAAASADFGIIADSPADPVSSNNQVRVTIPYQSGGADVGVSMTDSADPVRAGGEYSYTINVSNAGPEAAAGVRVSDTLPAALTFVSATGAGYTCTRAGQVVSCILGANLAAGASAALTITVRAPTTGQTINNQVSVGATTSDPNAANNTATQSTRVNDRTAEDLTTLLNPSATDPVAQAAVPVIADECVRSGSALADACREIIRAADEGRTGEVGDALRAIAPDEVLAQSLVLREIGATQFYNVDARLNELRRGGGGFSLSGLTVNYGDQSIPVALVGDALQAALGFGESDSGLISPWGFFINGSIGTGDQNLDFNRSRVGVNYDSKGITAGVDYRFSSRAIAGAAIGFSSYGADVSGGSELDSKSLILSGYGSYYLSDRLYLDSRLSYGNTSLDQQRRIHFQLGSTLFDALAKGETDATQISVASAMGYHLNYGPWSVTPSVGIRYTSTDVDAFDEAGANPFNVGYAKQSFDSVNFAAGIQVARAVSMSTGVLMPQFDVSLNSESGDDPSAEARLINGGTAELFRLQEENPDSSYGTAGLGFVYLMGNGRQAYFSYRRTFGYDSFDRGTLNLGGRFEF